MTTMPADYLALGIERDTFACIAVLPRRDAERLVFVLAGSGVPVRVSLAPPPAITEAQRPRGRRAAAKAQLWHVAVPGGLAGSPAAYVASLRDEPYNAPTCDAASGQHPQAVR